MWFARNGNISLKKVMWWFIKYIILFSFGSEIFLGDGTLTENEFVDGCMSDEAFVKVTQLAATFAFVSSFVKVILPIPIFFVSD